MTLLRCPNPATIEALRADTSSIKLCDPCAQRAMPDDVVTTLPIFRGQRPGTCESEG